MDESELELTFFGHFANNAEFNPEQTYDLGLLAVNTAVNIFNSSSYDVLRMSDAGQYNRAVTYTENLQRGSILIAVGDNSDNRLYVSDTERSNTISLKQERPDTVTEDDVENVAQAVDTVIKLVGEVGIAPSTFIERVRFAKSQQS